MNDVHDRFINQVGRCVMKRHMVNVVAMMVILLGGLSLTSSHEIVLAKPPGCTATVNCGNGSVTCSAEGDGSRCEVFGNSVTCSNNEGSSTSSC